MDNYFFNGTFDGMAYHAVVTRRLYEGGQRVDDFYDVDVKCFNNKTGNCEISFSRLIHINVTPKKAVRAAFNTAKREGCL